MINNNQSTDNIFTFLDFFNLICFLIPNTIFIFYSHLENKIPNLIIQNFTVMNLFGLYINGNIELLILGVLNIVVMISIIAADSETYNQFNVWFDALGITPHD